MSSTGLPRHRDTGEPCRQGPQARHSGHEVRRRRMSARSRAARPPGFFSDIPDAACDRNTFAEPERQYNREQSHLLAAHRGPHGIHVRASHDANPACYYAPPYSALPSGTLLSTRYRSWPAMPATSHQCISNFLDTFHALHDIDARRDGDVHNIVASQSKPNVAMLGQINKISRIGVAGGVEHPQQSVECGYLFNTSPVQETVENDSDTITM